MGGNTSQLPPTPAGFPYFCLTFRQWDKLKLLHAGQEELTVIRQCLQTHWPNGLQRESIDMGAYEIKFNGSPFSKNTSKQEAVAIKHFCCAILGELERRGWALCVSSDLSRTTDLTTWFFERKGANLDTPAGSHFFCVSLSSHDKLQVVNAPSHIHQAIKDACVASYGYGVQDDGRVGEDYELKLNGYPWYTASFEEGVYARRALLDIFRRLHSLHYSLKTTANLKGTADCLFFRQVEEAAPASFMMLSLNASDRIRLIDAPEDVIEAVGDCIRSYWSHGLQDQKDFRVNFGCYEYAAVSSRLLITTILQSLVAKGWAVCHSLDISRRVNDKAVIVFRSCAPASLPHFCLSPNDIDKFRLINAPPEIVELTGNVVGASWPYGIAKAGPNSGCFEWKVGGQPWSAYAGNDYAHARHLMSLLLQEYARKGWRVICSADVSAKYVHQQNGPDYPIDVHSWFFANTAGADGSRLQDPSAPPQFSDPPPSYSQVT